MNTRINRPAPPTVKAKCAVCGAPVTLWPSQRMSLVRASSLRCFRHRFDPPVELHMPADPDTTIADLFTMTEQIEQAVLSEPVTGGGGTFDGGGASGNWDASPSSTEVSVSADNDGGSVSVSEDF